MGWINLVKFVTRDRESVLGMPYEDAALELQDDLFVSELSILEPDVCVFATGPDYDRIIERYYPGVTFDDCGLCPRTLSRVNHERLPVRSFRTYHPKALRLQKKWDAVFEQLCGHITEMPSNTLLERNGVDRCAGSQAPRSAARSAPDR